MENRTKLPTPQKDLDFPLMKALENRRSIRKWKDSSLSNQDLSNLLWAACGITKEETKRITPGLRIELIDSRLTTMGLGLIVMKIAEMAREGRDLDFLVKEAEELKGRVQLLGVIDNLKYLEKGGRIGQAERLIGSTLKIMAVFGFRDGEVARIAQVRGGNKEKVVGKMIETFFSKEVGKTVTVGYGSSRDEGLELVEKIQKLYPDLEINFGQIGSVIAAHTGPGGLGMARIL